MLKILCHPVDVDFIKYAIMEEFSTDDTKLFYFTADPNIANANFIGDSLINSTSTTISYEYVGYEGKSETENPIGYLSYTLNPIMNSIGNIQIYSFEKSLTFIKDIFNKINEFVELHHKVTWVCVQGNNLEKAYDKLLKYFERKGYKVNKGISYDSTKDKEGNYRNGIIYEIINKNK